MLKDFTKLISAMYQNGMVMGVEVDTIHPPIVQAVLVFPKAAGESGTLLPLIQRLPRNQGQWGNEKKKRLRQHLVEVEAVKLGWWGAGIRRDHFPRHYRIWLRYAKDIDAKKTGNVSNACTRK